MPTEAETLRGPLIINIVRNPENCTAKLLLPGEGTAKL